LNILCNKLPVNGTAVTPEFFSQVEAVESSELDDVAELLHEAAT
jgi:hypothetical protein